MPHVQFQGNSLEKALWVEICMERSVAILQYSLGAKKHIKNKHINKVFMGLSRDFGGDFVYVFFSPIRNDPQN